MQKEREKHWDYHRSKELQNYQKLMQNYYRETQHLRKELQDPQI